MAKSRSIASYSTRRRWTETDARAVLSALEESGLSVHAFAAREGVDPQRLYNWRRRLGAPAPVSLPAFVEVRTGDVARIEVALRSGHVLRVPDAFNPETLHRLLRVLAEPAC